MNSNDYLALDFTDIRSVADLYAHNRREFIKRLGGGIFIFVTLGDLASAQEGARPRRSPGLPSDINAFLRIGEDGRVTGFTGKIEMGQGPITSLAQMLAEELDAPLESVSMVMGDTGLCPFDMGTWGSMTTRFFGSALRSAAAEAKAILLELAAEKLKVPASKLVTREGAIFDPDNRETRVTYGELAQGRQLVRHLEVKPALKDPSQFKICGKPVTRVDAKDKVTGKARYAGDIRLPGMLYARILHPPAHGARLNRVDTALAKEIPGVQVIQEGDLIAVLHELPDVAESAFARIKADFAPSELKTDDRTIFDHLLSVAPGPNVVAHGGNLDDGKKAAAKTFESTYLNSYVAHAAMETHTALASLEGDKLTVWASTQNPFGCRDEIAQALGFNPEQVRVIAPFVGGGFGGKAVNRQAVQAARLAKSIGKPVQVAWSREEEFFYDTFRPAAIVKISSGIDAAGKMVFWDYDVYFAGERGSQQFYSIPHHRTAARGSDWNGPKNSHPFGTGAWRAPGNNTNTFARESQVDIMAVAAGIDPVEFRLQQCNDARMTRVMKAAADKFGWTPAKGPSKRGYGVACGMDAGACVAAIAQVAVDVKRGTVQVKRVVCAQDMGQVINPEGAIIQMEGCITMGLGYALTEEVRFKNGQVLDTNFDTYEIPRFSWTPKIESVLVKADDVPPQGGGEPAIILMGGLIANAIFDATGARLFQLPMTPERLKAAIQKV